METPQDFVELVARCLKKDKTTRPSAAELLHSEPMLTWARRQQSAVAGGGNEQASAAQTPDGAASSAAQWERVMSA